MKAFVGGCALLGVLLLPAVGKGEAEHPMTVVCLGDSITRIGYPSALEKVLDVKVINAGIGGNTSRAGLDRLEKDVLQHHPEAVVILFGTNDSRLDAPQVHVPVDKYESNLGEMVDRCRTAKAKVVLCTPPPIDPKPYFQRHAREKFDEAGGLDKVLTGYREAVRRVAEAKKVPLVDLNAALAKDPSWLSPDGVHPTSEGSKKIASEVGKVLAPLLGRAAPEGKPRQS